MGQYAENGQLASSNASDNGLLEESALTNLNQYEIYAQKAPRRELACASAAEGPVRAGTVEPRT